MLCLLIHPNAQIVLKDTTDDDDLEIYLVKNHLMQVVVIIVGIYSSSTLYSIDGVGDTFNLGSNVSRGLKLRTNNTDALFIDTSQNIGIGTNTPARKLHISGTEPAIKLTDGSNNAYITYDNNNIRFHVSAAGADTAPTTSHTETNEVLRIRGGINTTHVLYGLQVGAAYNNTYTGWGSYDKATLKIPFYCTKTTSIHGTYTTWMNIHNAYNSSTGLAYWYSWENYSGTSDLKGNIPAIAIFGGSIQVSGNIHMYSDRRIKKEIVDANDDSCLNLIRQIKNRKYKYIDPFSEKESNNEVFGFIAQEVESVIPEAVGRSHQYIPNIMMEGDVEAHPSNNYQYYITTATDFTIENKVEGETYIKSYEINYSEDIIHTLKFISQENSKRILVECNESLPDRIFLYGEYVYDFRTLDKNKIYTISVGALQEIDRQQQADKAEISTLKTKVSTLETNYTNLQNQYNDLLSRITALENN